MATELTYEKTSKKGHKKITAKGKSAIPAAAAVAREAMGKTLEKLATMRQMHAGMVQDTDDDNG